MKSLLGDEIEREGGGGKKVSETVLLTHVASFSNVIMTWRWSHDWATMQLAKTPLSMKITSHCWSSVMIYHGMSEPLDELTHTTELHILCLFSKTFLLYFQKIIAVETLHWNARHVVRTCGFVGDLISVLMAHSTRPSFYFQLCKSQSTEVAGL